MTDTRVATQRWTVGAATITSVVEDQIDIPPGLLFPEATEADVLRHPWLVPDWADADGNIALRTQAFVVEIDGLTVLVDPCVGNGKVRWLPVWNDLDLPVPRTARRRGLRPRRRRARRAHAPARRPRGLGHAPRRRRVGADVHRGPAPLHRGRARVRPARRSCPARTCTRDSIAPIFDAGLADVVEPDADLGHGLRLEPTPGPHARAHVAVDRVRRRARADHRRLHAPPGAVRGAAPRRDRRRRRRSSHARRAGACSSGWPAPARSCSAPTSRPGPPAASHVDGDAWRFVAE